MQNPALAARVERVLPAVAILALAWLVLFPITSVDAYYHLAVGTWMLDHGSIPDHAVFSGTFPGAPWHDNEWGFQLVAAWLGRAVEGPDGVRELTPGGRVALVLLRAAALAATLLFVSWQLARARVGALARSVALVLTAFLTFNNLFWTIRPQIFTYLGVAFLGWWLERDRERGGVGTVMGLAALVAVWANLHGAFIVAVPLIAAEALGSWLEGERRRAIRLGAATALAPLAACLNPHGVDQLIHPFLYILQPEIHAGNAEWTRPDFLRLPLFLLTVAVAGIAVVTGRRRRYGDVMRAVVAIGLLTTAIRHLPLAALVVVPTLAVHFAGPGRWPAVREWFRTREHAGAGGTARFGVAVAAVVVVVALSGAKFVRAWPSFEERTVRPMPEFAVRRGVEIGGTVFNAYRFGGFLMFRLYPDASVFMDGRNDVYGTFRHDVFNPLADATAANWNAAWRDQVERHDVRWVLLDEGDGAVARLAALPGWRRVDDVDPGIAMFERVGAPPVEP